MSDRPPGPNRRGLLLTLGLLAVIAVVVVIAALASGGDDEGDPQARPSTTEPTPGTRADDQAGSRDVQVGSGDVSVLEVAETGFSTYTVPEAPPVGSFGLLIENTGDVAIVGAPLEVTVLDEAGATIETVPFIIGLIRPGETVGYGAELIQDPTNGIGDIEVQIRESNATYEVPAEGTLTASDISTDADELQTMTTFSVSSTYDEPIEYAATYVIYRDASGRIIAGGQGIVSSVPPGGQLTGAVFNLRMIPNIADAEVYVDPAAVEV
jgi:hypothetical protein